MYDVIVVGLGGMGSATAYQLAGRGEKVLGLDRHAPAHDRGSSHGGSRLIRQAYFEAPAYVPLLLRAYELWERLEAETGQDLMTLCGGLMLGRRGSVVLAPHHGTSRRTPRGSSPSALRPPARSARAAPPRRPPESPPASPRCASRSSRAPPGLPRQRYPGVYGLLERRVASRRIRKVRTPRMVFERSSKMLSSCPPRPRP
jgi:glycine/D-amino acid oxidase-like deaminating enzyme